MRWAPKLGASPPGLDSDAPSAKADTEAAHAESMAGGDSTPSTPERSIRCASCWRLLWEEKEALAGLGNWGLICSFEFAAAWPEPADKSWAGALLIFIITAALLGMQWLHPCPGSSGQLEKRPWSLAAHAVLIVGCIVWLLVHVAIGRRNPQVCAGAATLWSLLSLSMVRGVPWPSQRQALSTKSAGGGVCMAGAEQRASAADGHGEKAAQRLSGTQPRPASKAEIARHGLQCVTEDRWSSMFPKPVSSSPLPQGTPLEEQVGSAASAMPARPSSGGVEAAMHHPPLPPSPSRRDVGQSELFDDPWQLKSSSSKPVEPESPVKVTGKRATFQKESNQEPASASSVAPEELTKNSSTVEAPMDLHPEEVLGDVKVSKCEGTRDSLSSQALSSESNHSSHSMDEAVAVRGGISVPAVTLAAVGSGARAVADGSIARTLNIAPLNKKPDGARLKRQGTLAQTDSAAGGPRSRGPSASSSNTPSAIRPAAPAVDAARDESKCAPPNPDAEQGEPADMDITSTSLAVKRDSDTSVASMEEWFPPDHVHSIPSVAVAVHPADRGKDHAETQKGVLGDSPSADVSRDAYGAPSPSVDKEVSSGKTAADPDGETAGEVWVDSSAVTAVEDKDKKKDDEDPGQEAIEAEPLRKAILSNIHRRVIKIGHFISGARIEEINDVLYTDADEGFVSDIVKNKMNNPFAMMGSQDTDSDNEPELPLSLIDGSLGNEEFQQMRERMQGGPAVQNNHSGVMGILSSMMASQSQSRQDTRTGSRRASVVPGSLDTLRASFMNGSTGQGGGKRSNSKRNSFSGPGGGRRQRSKSFTLDPSEAGAVRSQLDPSAARKGRSNSFSLGTTDDAAKASRALKQASQTEEGDSGVTSTRRQSLLPVSGFALSSPRKKMLRADTVPAGKAATDDDLMPFDSDKATVTALTMPFSVPEKDDSESESEQTLPSPTERRTADLKDLGQEEQAEGDDGEDNKSRARKKTGEADDAAQKSEDAGEIEASASDVPVFCVPCGIDGVLYQALEAGKEAIRENQSGGSEQGEDASDRDVSSSKNEQDAREKGEKRRYSLMLPGAEEALSSVPVVEKTILEVHDEEDLSSTRAMIEADAKLRAALEEQAPEMTLKELLRRGSIGDVTVQSLMRVISEMQDGGKHDGSEDGEDTADIDEDDEFYEDDDEDSEDCEDDDQEAGPPGMDADTLRLLGLELNMDGGQVQEALRMLMMLNTGFKKSHCTCKEGGPHTCMSPAASAAHSQLASMVHSISHSLATSRNQSKSASKVASKSGTRRGSLSKGRRNSQDRRQSEGGRRQSEGGRRQSGGETVLVDAQRATEEARRLSISVEEDNAAGKPRRKRISSKGSGIPEGAEVHKSNSIPKRKSTQSASRGSAGSSSADGLPRKSIGDSPDGEERRGVSRGSSAEEIPAITSPDGSAGGSPTPAISPSNSAVADRSPTASPRNASPAPPGRSSARERGSITDSRLSEKRSSLLGSRGYRASGTVNFDIEEEKESEDKAGAATPPAGNFDNADAGAGPSKAADAGAGLPSDAAKSLSDGSR